MAGFLGKQFLLSGTLDANEHSTITLKNGTVITGYFSANGGPMQIYSFDPKTKVTTSLSAFGDLSTNFSDPYLLASDDGGFKIVYNVVAVNGGLFYRQFDKDGSPVGTTQTLVTGWIEGTQSYDTSTGFFVTYRDRTTGAEYQNVGAFYDDAGNLLKKYDFQADVSPGGAYGSRPMATELANGNLAVVWKLSNVDGTVLQLFRPNGNKIATAIDLGNVPLNTNPGVIETHPDGGFLVAHAPVLSNGGLSYLGPVIIQRYTDKGVKTGPEISFDTTGDANSQMLFGTKFDVAITKDGLIAIAWTGNGTTNANGTDVFFAVLSPTGKVIVGPQAADVTLFDDQSEVQFSYLKNGQLFLTFKDDATVQFSHVASIEGRFIVDPDYIWEGNSKDNTNNGTSGDDILLGLRGNDILSGGRGEDFIRGGLGDDTLSGGNRLDVLYGEGGNDKLFGDKGADTLYGGGGRDELNGGFGNDELYAGKGNDTVRGGKGDDLGYGGDGNDKLYGGTDNDKLYGEAGNDKLWGGTGNDELNGNDGRDTLKGEVGNDVLSGGAGKDKLFGGAGIDVLRGGDDNDVLRGGADADALYGDAGNDRLYGGEGNDRFYDEKGNDAYYGGAGADTFQFFTETFGRDRIKDFEVGVDTLDMGWLANALEAKGQSITVSDVASGVKFAVDADNWVIIENLTLAQLTEGTDYFITSPI